MKLIKVVFIILSLLYLNGCAHSIDITPKTDLIKSSLENMPKIQKSVGYFIPETLINTQVNSRGGGGDSVNYYPYRDMANAFEVMLSSVFEKVTQLNNSNDVGVDYVIRPEIVTDSFSTSSITWPPTNFTVNLAGKITDPTEKQIKIIKVIGEGQAEYSEFFSERGLAGMRAMEDALVKMKRSLFDINYENIAINNKSESVERLESLKGLNERGLITAEEYAIKKREILDGM